MRCVNWRLAWSWRRVALALVDVLGVNLLLYGPPGTGKTEFAKTLGGQLGFSVQFVGETNDKNGEPSRSERLAALLIANAIGAVARKTILVVDEADDLFDAFGDANRRGSKVFLNRLLERSAAPTIWIANDPDRLGPAIVRRMNLALRFPKPRLSVRKAMVGAIAESHGLRLDEDSKLILARAHASPGGDRQRHSLCRAHWRFRGRRDEHPPGRTARLGRIAASSFPHADAV